mmetsp:Transcript_18113/g.57879  ORF Transcript_18113/g.57879 Transcript_18113/m.57879 type:complete len:167 (-) Transcript_18113:38-538(-)
MTTAGSVPLVTLGAAALGGGSRFVFVLTCSTFLGVSSDTVNLTVTRAAQPVPSITISAPPVLTIPSSSTLTLQARATVASCLAEGSSVNGLSYNPIDFRWSHVASVPSSAAPLVLGAASRGRRDLVVAGSQLRGGVRYALRVTGCMLSQVSVCGSATTSVELLNEP